MYSILYNLYIEIKRILAKLVKRRLDKKVRNKESVQFRFRYKGSLTQPMNFLKSTIKDVQQSINYTV